MFQEITNYMTKSLEERQNHLRLDDPCIEIGTDSRECRALLAHLLETTLPSRKIAFCCHACNNAKCSNPRHLYWGTNKENVQDAIAAGTHFSLNKTPWNLGKRYKLKPESEETKARKRKAWVNKSDRVRNKSGTNQYSGR